MTAKFYQLPQDLAARVDLTASAKVVFAVVKDRIGHNAKGWPGERWIAKAAGIGRGTVPESLKQLEKAGVLEVDRRGKGKGNHYTIPKCPDSGQSKPAKCPDSGRSVRKLGQKCPDSGRIHTKTRRIQF